MINNVGQQIGNYRLTRLLGHGGYADVYLGEHIYLNTQAAIKILHTQLEQEDIETFRNEALTIAHLVHPHIIRVLDFNVEDTTPFLVMDYAPNGNLRERYPKGQQLTSASVVSYTKQVASALQYAHDSKLIHRDVKPENMLLGHNFEILLSDFGIALVAESSRSQKTEDEVVGTMAYMAPEQLQGKARPASDQYALGAVVYEWLCGTRPFTGSYLEIVGQHLSSPPTPLHNLAPDIPYPVEQVVLRALAKDPHQRFPRVQDFADALELAYQAPAVSIASPSIPPAQPERPVLPEMPQQPQAAQADPPYSPAPTPSTSFSRPPYNSLAKVGSHGKSVVKGGVKLLLGAVLIFALLLCGLGYTTFHLFAPRPTTFSSADMTQASNTVNAFITDIDQRNYNHAYTAFGPPISNDTSQQEFIQQAQQEDTCDGTIINSTRDNSATTTHGNTISYVYTVTRSKLSKAYQLHVSVQRSGSGSWQITDYNSNVDSIKPMCQ